MGEMGQQIGRSGAALPKRSGSFTLDLAAIYCSLIGDKSAVFDGKMGMEEYRQERMRYTSPSLNRRNLSEFNRTPS